MLTYRWNHWISGYSPWSYHLVNVMLHVLVTGLMYQLGKLLLSRTAAGFASVLFAVHPIHTEAVASVVGRADLLAGVFLLLSVISYVRYRERYEPREHVCRESPKTRSPSNRFKKNRRYQHLDRCKFEESAMKKYALLVSTIICAALAIFCKEPGFAALPICLVYELLMMARIKIIKFETVSRKRSLMRSNVDLC